MRLVLIFLLITANSTMFFAQYKPSNDLKVRSLEAKMREHRRNLDSLNHYARLLYDYSINKNIKEGKINSLMALGNVETRKGNLEKANQYFHELISIGDVEEYKSVVEPAMNNLALNHRRLRRNDSAFYYFKKLESRYRGTNNIMGMAGVSLSLGQTYMAYQNLDSAEYYLKESLLSYNRINQDRFIPQNLSLLAELYYQKKDYKKAIQLADSSQVISEKLNMKRNFGRNYSILSRSYKALGNDERSKYFSDLERKSLVRLPKNAIARPGLNDRYDKEAATRSAKLRNENISEIKFYKTNLFIASCILLLLSALLILFYRRNRSIKKENDELQNLIDGYRKTGVSGPGSDTKKEGNIIILKSKATLTAEDILYIKSDGHYLEYYIKNKPKPEIDRSTMAYAIENIGTKNFTMIHRSYIVNINEIKILNSTQLMMSSGVWLPLSRKYKMGLRALLNKK